MKDRLHSRNKAAWTQGQDTEVDDTLSYMSDESLTLTALGSDSESTASTADIAALAGDNTMDGLAGDTDAASFRYIRLVVYSAKGVLPKDYNGFSDP
ncbi:hypothetical protein ABBQ38_014325 [Trebouxia sp. C0009 RCD-2024]